MDNLQPRSQPDLQAPAQENTDWKRVFRDLFETVGLALILFLVINTVSARVRVDGFSMQPTLQDGEFILVNKLAYRMGTYTRGDIIVFRSPTTPDLDLIKRVIGLPGDQVVAEGGHILVNSQALNEAYINGAPEYNGSWKVPEGHVFVLGDNRNNSSDSHQWGYLPVQNVIGKALFIYWPPPEWATVDHVKIAVAAP